MMGGLDPGRSDVKEASFSVVVTRADGTVEDHGVVAHYKRPEPDLSPLARALAALRRHMTKET